MTRYDRLWRALAAASSSAADDLVGAIRTLPPIEELPSPWITWTLIGLVRHLRRQLWVGEIVVERLGGNLERLARRGALGHPRDRAQSGVVRGVAEWEYFFHGCGCCLTHRVTGEEIDVDFFGPTADVLNDWFYLNHLRSLRFPEPPEERLLALHASVEPVRLAIDELRYVMVDSRTNGQVP